MGPRGVVQATSQWYLIARDGEMVIRVHPGMPLGETAAGELSFDACDAQIELDVADDGGLLLSAVDEHELESAGGTRRHRERLALDLRAEIRLPHNVLQLDTDFVDPAPADETVEIRAVRPIEDITEPPGGRLLAGFVGKPLVPIVPDRRNQWTGARGQRILIPWMAVIGSVGIGFALLSPALRDGTAPGPSATVGAGQAAQTAAARVRAVPAENFEPGADTPPSAVALAPKPLLLPALDAAPATEPGGDEGVAERSDEQLPEPQPVAASTIEPVVPASVERPAIRQVAQTVNTAEALADREPIDTESDATVVGEPQQSHEAAEVARRRALFAADQALAQGRLTTPPEASAFTLYSRVLALDPGSQEARSGLQSVRQGLINRALAQLAGDALDDARRSLQAAAEAGVDPMLVADLRGEVDYRQRLIDARPGRYE